MNHKVINKLISFCLTIAILATYSITVSAKSDKTIGELSIFGTLANGEIPVVSVNGETAQNGRSIFSSSNIVTSKDASAIINIAKIGKIELAPDTNLTLTFDQTGISGDLTAGKLTVLGSVSDVNIKIPNGQVVKLSSGESVDAANNSTSSSQTQTTAAGNGVNWVAFAVVFGGSVASIIAGTAIDASNNNNENVVVSPFR